MNIEFTKAQEKRLAVAIAEAMVLAFEDSMNWQDSVWDEFEKIMKPVVVKAAKELAKDEETIHRLSRKKLERMLS